MTRPRQPRQTKTPRQRAEEALGVAQRRVVAITKKRDQAKADVDALEHELADAELRLEYVQKNPDLPRQPTPTGTTTTTEEPA